MTVESYLKRNLSPAKVLPRVTSCVVIVLAAAAFFAPNRSALANTYSELTSADKTFVDEQCLPIQYQEGATAFRQCVIEQTALLFSVETPSEALLTSDEQFTVETPLQAQLTSNEQFTVDTPLQAQQTPNEQSAVETPLQAQLTFDEQFAIQQFCKASGDSGPDSYARCAAEQVDSLQGVPATNLSQISEDENYALQQSCYAIQSTAGVRAYRECLNSELVQLASVPSPDLSTLSLLDKNALQLRCSANNEVAASYRSCLLEAMNGATVPAIELNDLASDDVSPASPEPTPEVVPTAAPSANAPVVDEPLPLNTTIPTPVTDAAQLDTTPIEAAEVDIQTTAQETVLADPVVLTESSELTDTAAVQDDLADTLDTTNSTESTAAQATNSIAPAGDTIAPSETTTSDDAQNSLNAGSILEKAKTTGSSMWAQLQSNLSGLSDTNRAVMLGALALPLGLIGFWLLMRGRSSEPETVRAPAYENPLIDRVRPSQQQRVRDDDYISPVADPQDIDEQFDELFADDAPAESWQTAPTRVVDPQHAPTPEMLDLNAAEPEPPFDRGHLKTWLDKQEPESQLSLAVEFMIYWMAYADERYEPDQKQKIFALTDPNEHDLIKRWVLKEDVQAFAEVTQWLQSNASHEQHEQILKLLMALLVCENALTPSQNTMLRFLGDVFGAGSEQLDAIYQMAYGQAMPSLPRVDKPLWWDEQHGDNLKRWDARSLSRQSDETQFRVKLGLPISGEMDKQQIQMHYHRAAKRCNPQTFNLLPDREQMLVDRQLAKFEQARDALLEVFA